MKKVYEKPAMLVEEFVATQSVAASCGNVLNFNPIEVPTNTHICISPSCGHTTYTNLSNLDRDRNGTVTIFNDANGCDYRYDVEAKGDLSTMGKALTGNKAWNSSEHAMIIGEIHIPS